jgi:hypothetical protein
VSEAKPRCRFESCPVRERDASAGATHARLRPSILIRASVSRFGGNVNLTEEQEKDLDEMAERFKETKGGK